MIFKSVLNFCFMTGCSIPVVRALREGVDRVRFSTARQVEFVFVVGRQL